MGAFLDLLARLDPEPGLRGKQFEHVCKWFLTNDPTYRSTLRRVWLWDEWSGRWGADAGIDLVAEDHEGRLWAIQCKAYNPDNAVTKADVDKFLSESSRSVFSYRLLIATTDKLHHVATAHHQRPGEEGRLRRAERPADLRGQLAHRPAGLAPVPAAEACQAARLSARRRSEMW